MLKRSCDYGHSAGALSLTGLEYMSDEEKAARISSVANDMTASIIYIAKQAEAGNVTEKHTAPIYDFIDRVCGTEKRQKKSLLRELERQDEQIAQAVKRHQEDIRELMACASTAILRLKARADKLEAELERLRAQDSSKFSDSDNTCPGEAVVLERDEPSKRNDASIAQSTI
ncbi:hypothetical protein AJ80_09526 [Polytolypa hystricis UAMH7299]|uniref:Uncharacterized protein n=1 Tax=Polytolypa hystricis (strain UAMH7299) TaxID=1447883 RepID=A0A2B7WP07_POLH7|nr:hypothetical protein AJ80_09526 [Polytolypa hystricis UAMH7299]